MKKTVLIFGVSSFVGSNLAQILSEHYRVIGTYHTNPVEIPGVTCYPCDILKKEYVTSLTGVIKPDYTIYAVGLSSLTECKMFPKKADALNSAGAVNCSFASERVGSKFIYLSSCFVLGGEDMDYREADTPFPNTVYGTTLSSTEFYIQRSCLNYLILRSCPLYGRSYTPFHPNWFEYLQASFVKNEVMPADDSVHTGFLDVQLFGKIVRSLLEDGVTNRLLQVSSKDSISRLEFAKLYSKIFKKDENLIQGLTANFPTDNGPMKVVKSTSSKTLHYRLDTTNLEALLGLSMPRVEESLMLTYKRLGTTSG